MTVYDDYLQSVFTESLAVS